MSISNLPGAYHVPAFDVHDRLTKARNDAGLTQSQMAELLGVGRRSIVRYESSGNVPRSVILSYHVATKTDLSWLENGYTPRDLNPEPTGYGLAWVTPLRQVA